MAFHFLQTAISGELWLSESLDFEAFPGPYSITVTVCDNGERGANLEFCAEESFNKLCAVDPVDISVTVSNINDNPPVCPEIVHVCIQEGDYSGRGIVVTTFTCTDADYPVNPEFTYSIDRVEVHNGGADPSLNGLFQVVPNSGTVEAIGVFDREIGDSIRDEYLVHVVVSDTENPIQSTMMVVSKISIHIFHYYHCY